MDAFDILSLNVQYRIRQLKINCLVYILLHMQFLRALKGQFWTWGLQGKIGIFGNQPGCEIDISVLQTCQLSRFGPKVDMSGPGQNWDFDQMNILP